MDPRRARTHGLQRVNRLTGWLAGGAMVASGAFVALLARPHATSAASHAPTGSVGAGVTTTLDPYAPDGGSGYGGAVAQPLSPPAQVPVPSPSQGQVSSGGS